MSETKHTPGPWTAKYSKYDDGVLLVQAGMPSNRVLARFGSENEPPDETDIANARLIAAAPALLKALKMVIHFVAISDHPSSVGRLAKAKAAIALATEPTP